MQYIEIKGKEGEAVKYLFLLNNKVFKKLFASKNIDPVNDKMEWVDDPDVISFVGYEALKAGCEYDGIDLPFTEKQFGLVATRRVALEISNYLMRELQDAMMYAISHFPKTEESEGEDEKK